MFRSHVKSGRTGTLLFAVLGGPLAWAVQFQVLTAAVPGLCAGRFQPVPWVATVLALLVSGSALAVALRVRRRIHASITEGEGELGWERLLAVGGIVASAFFSIVIVVQAVPLLMLDPCLR